MIPSFLLSIASPETISWAGFAVLIGAMVGEVGVCLIPPKWDNFHAHMTFVLLLLAAAGYSVERIGDDAIVSALEGRATAAESKITKMETMRWIDDAQYPTFVGCLKVGPKGPVYLRPGWFDRDAKVLGDRIAAALKEAGFPDPPPWPGGNAQKEVMNWNIPGVFLLLRDLQNAPPGARTVQDCLLTIGIRAGGQIDPTEPDGTTS